jgi:hypothetical protein
MDGVYIRLQTADCRCPPSNVNASLPYRHTSLATWSARIIWRKKKKEKKNIRAVGSTGRNIRCAAFWDIWSVTLLILSYTKPQDNPEAQFYSAITSLCLFHLSILRPFLSSSVLVVDDGTIVQTYHTRHDCLVPGRGGDRSACTLAP